MAKLQPAQVSIQDLMKQKVAAQALRDALSTEADDGDLIRDTIEGETTLHEAIEQVDMFILADESLLAGIKRAQESLAARAARVDKRIDYYRSAIEQAMLIGEIKEKMELPTGTISLKKVPSKLEITDEPKIAAMYWKQPDPVLDRKALMDVLKTYRDAVIAAEEEGTEPPPPPVEGAELGAEGVTLAIRRG